MHMKLGDKIINMANHVLSTKCTDNELKMNKSVILLFIVPYPVQVHARTMISYQPCFMKTHPQSNV